MNKWKEVCKVDVKNYITRGMTRKYPRKRLCKNCKYCKIISGGFPICDYGQITGQTCLHLERGRVIDSRGESPNCKLFEKDS